MSIPSAPENSPFVTVVVPVYRGGDEFRQCLGGLAALAPPPQEIIVVVDGEDDGSGDAAEAFGARVLRLPRRSGPAAARNAGARAARGAVLFFLDADVVPAPTVVAQVRAAFRADPGLAALIGSYDDAPGHPAFLSQYRNLLHHYVHQTAEEQARTFWGACGAVRREAFFAVGSFDEHFANPSVEDVELGQRLARAGRRIRLIKDIQVKHLKRWDMRGMLRTDVFQRALPWARLLLREGHIPNDLNLRLQSRFSAGLAWLLLGTLGAVPLWPTSAAIAGLAAFALLGLNAPFYRFLQERRGLGFALRAVPWHWLYFLYASGGFAYVRLVERGDGSGPLPLAEVSTSAVEAAGSQ
ncbi:glycosyltransferase [Methylomagnum ishizawai]|uniref:glycosyltransferase n=1 Tax=Methylomagnum ishizawai TaxID=1760988 RepID=UPI001FE2EDC5|nr:glycosyltransferase family 2 protein [Methylomagnum ishizawai]